MKAIFIYILLGLGSIYGQNIKVEYHFRFLLNNDDCRSQLIIPDESTSFYEMFDIRESAEEEITHTTDEDGNPKVLIMAGGAVYKNRIVIKQRGTGTMDYYKVENDNYTKISEKLNTIAWELLDGTKTILGYKCLQAKGVFKGKLYHAWYANDIPYSDGPWKFNGLPGLILQIDSEDKHLAIKAEKITLNSKNLPTLKTPDFKEAYTWREYVQQQVKEYDQMKKSIKSSISESENLTSVNFSMPEIDTTFKVGW